MTYELALKEVLDRASKIIVRSQQWVPMIILTRINEIF